MTDETERPQASYLPNGPEEDRPLYEKMREASRQEEPEEEYDEETGEVLEEPNPEEDRKDDPQPGESPKQEILPQGYERAADQQIIQTVAHTGGSFIDMLEDGRLSRDLHRELAKVQHALTIENDRTDKKAKGQITITIDLEKEGEMYGARAKKKVKLPEPPRPKSVMWGDGSGSFTRFPPNQTQIFGPRQVRNVNK